MLRGIWPLGVIRPLNRSVFFLGQDSVLPPTLQRDPSALRASGFTE